MIGSSPVRIRHNMGAALDPEICPHGNKATTPSPLCRNPCERNLPSSGHLNAIQVGQRINNLCSVSIDLHSRPNLERLIPHPNSRLGFLLFLLVFANGRTYFLQLFLASNHSSFRQIRGHCRKGTISQLLFFYLDTIKLLNNKLCAATSLF
jgi:hypothetical protein